MYPRPKLEKAKLKTFDKDAKPGEEVIFQFNPTEISIERGCGFDSKQSDPNTINDYGGLDYSGAKSDQLSMSFILDTTEPALTNPANALVMMSPVIVSSPTLATAKDAGSVPMLGAAVNDESVMGVLHGILNMTKLSKAARDAKKQKKAEKINPRLVQFSWGDKENGLHFSGAIEKFSFKITLFDSDGIPKRAEVELGLIGIYGPFDGDAEDMLWGEAFSTVKSVKQLS